MATYNILGGGTIKAENNLEIVQKLNESSMFGKRKDLSQFMVETSIACKTQTGSEVRVGNFDMFVEDLIKAGFLTEI